MDSAIKFVRKFDINMARHAVLNMPNNWEECYLRECNLEFVKSPPSRGDWVCMNSLKQVVEAFDLVEYHGGLETAKNLVDYPNFLNDEDTNTLNMQLKQAVKLVEKCNA